LSRFDEEVKALEDIIKVKKEAITEADVTMKKVENDIQTAMKDRNAAANHVTAMEEKLPWIVDEKRYAYLLNSGTGHVSPWSQELW